MRLNTGVPSVHQVCDEISMGVAMGWGILALVGQEVYR